MGLCWGGGGSVLVPLLTQLCPWHMSRMDTPGFAACPMSITSHYENQHLDFPLSHPRRPPHAPNASVWPGLDILGMGTQLNWFN